MASGGTREERGRQGTTWPETVTVAHVKSAPKKHNIGRSGVVSATVQATFPASHEPNGSQSGISMRAVCAKVGATGRLQPIACEGIGATARLQPIADNMGQRKAECFAM